MVGDAELALEIFGARGLIRENGRHQVVGAHALDGRRHLPSSRETGDGQRPAGIPPPARGKHGRGQQGLDQHVFHGIRVQKLEDDLERKRVLLAK